MMREGLAQWDFVIAAYAIGVLATIAMVAWAWRSMRRSEKRRDEVKRR